MKILVWLAVGGLLASSQTRAQHTTADQDKVAPPLVSMSPVAAVDGGPGACKRSADDHLQHSSR